MKKVIIRSRESNTDKNEKFIPSEFMMVIFANQGLIATYQCDVYC